MERQNNLSGILLKKIQTLLTQARELCLCLIERINGFLFFNDTNLFSVCNACFLLFWTSHLAINHHHIVHRDISGMITLASGGVYFLTFLVVATVALLIVSLSFSTRRAVFANGYALLLSGFAWAIIAGSYISKYPPFTPQMGMYAIYSMFCIIAGRKMISTSNKMKKKQCLHKDT